MNEDDSKLEVLLDYLRRVRGFDFTGYKRSTLRRRVQRRMQDVGISDPDEYLDHLEVHPSEFNELFNTILINVTGFFRDGEPWDVLADEVIPPLVEKAKSRTIRVWSAGCASGEEPFTLAMLLAEAVGLDVVSERVKIYATDVDEEALAQARSARFSEKAVENVPPDLLGKYFRRDRDEYQFNSELRRFVIFGRHDLVQDAPISRVDLLVCRNTLMYFNADTQGQILKKFHFSLNVGGHLMLGKSEMLLTRTNLFAPFDLRNRIFIPVGKQPRTAPLLSRLLYESDGEEGDGFVKDVALENHPTASIIVDAGRILVAANGAARDLLGIRLADVGLPFQDVEASYRPTELRSRIDEAFASSAPVLIGEVEVETGGRGTIFDVSVTPTTVSGGDPLGVLITFKDNTESVRLRRELEGSNRQLETALEELHSTVEELETTNEELQSTNEELETTNEELQSTNEELETMNEELQSTNEELESANVELRIRGQDLMEARGLLESILENHPAAVAVLNSDKRIRLWNSRARNLWGLHLDDVRDAHVADLDIGLDVAALSKVVERTLEVRDATTLTMPGTSRRGVDFECTVIVVPIGVDGHEGAVIFMNDEKRPSEPE